MIFPAGIKSKVKEIWSHGGGLAEAFCPQSVTLCLTDDIDVSRGDMIVGLDYLPGRSGELQARVCWMNQRPLTAGKKFYLKHTTQMVQAAVTQVENRINFTTFEAEPNPGGLALNGIGTIRLRTAEPLLFDGYETITGSPARSSLSSKARTPPSPPGCFFHRSKARQAGIHRLRDLMRMEPRNGTLKPAKIEVPESFRKTLLMFEYLEF